MVYRKTAKVEDTLADKRQRILDAARELVAQGGFKEAPIAAIAKMSGVAVGTVYHHFGSKSELLAELIDTISQRELDVITAEAKREPGAAANLERVLRLYTSRALRGRRLAFALLAEPLEAAIDEIRLDYRRRFAKLLEGIIKQGVRAGEFPAQSTATTAACLVGACDEALVGPILDDSASARKRNEVLDAIVSFCLGAVHSPRAGSWPGSKRKLSS